MGVTTSADTRYAMAPASNNIQVIQAPPSPQPGQQIEPQQQNLLCVPYPQFQVQQSTLHGQYPQLQAKTGDVVAVPPGTAAAVIATSQSIPQLKYQPGAGDPRFTPWLPDESGGFIQLDGMTPNDKIRPTTLIEKVPSLPFWPGDPVSQVEGDSQWGAASTFVSNLTPKPIETTALRSADGWYRMPHAAPVYVIIPGFGAGIAMYWSTSLLPLIAGKPAVNVYAVLKLTPFPVTTLDARYVGKFFKIFATWCKPMKWAIGQYP